MIMEFKKIETIQANSGVQALDEILKDRDKKCCDVRIKFIFMDLCMPDLDGFKSVEMIIEALEKRLL